MKTKLGISIGLMGSLVYFAGLFGGWTPILLIAGFILIYETNAWLKKSAITSAVLMVGFYIISALINLIPNTVGILDSLFGMFDGNVDLPKLSIFMSFLNSTISVIEKIIFLVLGFLALRQGSINIAFLDKFIDKHTNED